MSAPKDIAGLLRRAIRDSKRSINGIATEADVSEGVLRRFMDGGGITLATAQALATALGMRLDLRGS
jgi:DNA-binding phage protein